MLPHCKQLRFCSTSGTKPGSFDSLRPNLQWLLCFAQRLLSFAPPAAFTICAQICATTVNTHPCRPRCVYIAKTASGSKRHRHQFWMPSSTLKLRLPPLGHRLDAFLEVPRLEVQLLLPAFVPHGFLQ